MNRAQILGLVRTVLTAGAGVAVGRGLLDNDTAMQVVGAVVTIATAVWSVLSPEKREA